ncbi:MAG: ferrochelatase [Rhodanobacteraceae bacterium]
MSQAASDQAVLMVNLGTPEAPTAAALRPWLAEFLGDERVIDLRPRWLWWLILHGVILRIRPARSARAYQAIWRDDGSPLRVLSENLCDAVAVALARREAQPPQLVLAMRYGQPSVQASITRLQAEGVRKLLVLPMYPQYSATSTGSVIDAVADAAKSLRWPPEVRLVNDYHDNHAWLDTLAASVRRHWQEQGRGERLLLSFHGIPQRYVRLGDPYLDQCRATAAGLRQRLGLDASQAPMSFQSRVGREPWLQPYTDHTVRELAQQGIRKLDVICPGFAVDCLETLEEIAEENAAYFREAGGESLRYIPALNDSIEHAEMLAGLISDYTQDWRAGSTPPARHGEQGTGNVAGY